MFSEEQITKIFSNIEQIYLFHQEILRQLEECFVEDDPYASEIGAVFLNNVSFIAIIMLGRARGWGGGGGLAGWKKRGSKGCEKSTGDGERDTRIGILQGGKDILRVAEPLRVEREPGKNYARSGEYRSCCHQPSSPPRNLPTASLYQELVVFEANYSHLVRITETRLRHLL